MTTLADGPAANADLPAVSDMLREVGYRPDGIAELLQSGRELSLRADDVVVHKQRLRRSPGPLADVITLCGFGEPVPRRQIERALGTRALSALLESGAVEEDGTMLRPLVRIIAHDELYIAADLHPQAGAQLDPEHVPGINPPAVLLAGLTVRRSHDLVLDLGTGNGIQALLAAAQAEHVVATDINPRALGFARFNASLNGVSNIEWRLGDAFAPVAGERFDVVVSNPPYVISPESTAVYRDSGREPGALCATIVAELPRHLRPDGFGTVLVSWPQSQGEDLWAVPERWLAEDADAWLLHSLSQDPLAHAADWNRPLSERGGPEYGEALDRWTAFAEQRGITAIAFGAVVLHGHTSARGRIIGRDRLVPVPGSASDLIQRVFAAALQGPPMPDARPRLAPGHRLDQTLYYADGLWQLASARLSSTTGMELAVALDAVMVQALVALDGTRTVAEAAAIAADNCNIDASDRPALTALVGQLTAELQRLGLLVAE